MSCTELFYFNKRGNAKFLGETPNAFRGAIKVWGILESKYLEPKEYRRYGVEQMKEIWDLHNDPRLPRTEKICLLSTFDNVIVLTRDLPELVKSFEEFEGETSLYEQAALIKPLIVKDKDVLAIGWNQTSVNADTWLNFGGYSRNDNAKPYNILKMDDRHWNLFEHESLS